MTRMYIANASLQKHIFVYRIPEQSKERMVSIEPMSQAPTPDDLTHEDVAAIIEQHKQYGFLSVEEMRSSRLRSRTTLMYSMGKPISSIAIDSLFQANKGILDDFGKRIRQETAIVANLAVNKALDEQQQQGLHADLRDFEMSVVEDEPAGGYTTPVPVSEGYRVRPDAPVPARGRGRRKG